MSGLRVTSNNKTLMLSLVQEFIQRAIRTSGAGNFPSTCLRWLKTITKLSVIQVFWHPSNRYLKCCSSPAPLCLLRVEWQKRQARRTMNWRTPRRIGKGNEPVHVALNMDLRAFVRTEQSPNSKFQFSYVFRDQINQSHLSTDLLLWS